MKKTIPKYLFLFISSFGFSQSIISGYVKDSIQELTFASVMLKDSLSKTILEYTYTDEQGRYELKTNKTGALNLMFTALGFESKSLSIFIKNQQESIQANVTLKEKIVALNEVILMAESPTRVKEDTISFKTKYFTNGTEQNVEELLKKIPGLQVDAEGVIKVGNKEIEKLMVDGDDFFENGYKVLSKNMPAYPIEEVEILNNYSNNRLLKGIEESEKVALNLKLDEKSKRIWFGNIEAGHSYNSYYNFKANLMNFGKKNKYYFLTNLNSIGNNAAGEIAHLIRPLRNNEPNTLGDNQSVHKLLNLSESNPVFGENRTNFNNAELLSLNAIFNPTEKLKIKTLGFFNWDEKAFFRNSEEMVIFGSTNFNNTENFKLLNKNSIAFGKLDLTYNLSKNKILEATTKANFGGFNDSSNLIFNSSATLENLEHQNKLIDQKIHFTNKFSDRKVLLITGQFINEITPQTYQINQFFYKDLFPQANSANNVKQISDSQMQFLGINAHILDRKKNGDLLEFQFGNEYRKDLLSSAFSVLENDITVLEPLGFQNNNTYGVNNLYVKTKYRFKINDFGLSTSVDFHQLFNSLERNNEQTKDQVFFINPSIGLDWKINHKNKLNANYSYNTTNAAFNNVYSDFVLTSFRSFSRGSGTFDQLNSSSFSFNYQLGNWSDRFFANTFVFYTKNHDFFSNNTIIDQNYTLSKRILIKDREFLTVNSKLDYYLKFMATNFKLDLGFSKNEFKNIVNNSTLRLVKYTQYNYGFELRSGFKGVFNYHTGAKWNTASVKTTLNNSFTNNKSFLDLIFIVNNSFNFKLTTERYFFGNLPSDNTYYFSDFSARYTLKENKLSLKLNANNLFNTKHFRNFSISDIGTSTTEFRLLPRYVMLGMEYRF